MDPLSMAIGTASSVLGLTDIIVRSVKGLVSLQTLYKSADLLVTIVVGHLRTANAVLKEIHEWLEGLNDAAPYAGLLDDIQSAVGCCMLIANALHIKINNLERNAVYRLTPKGKLLYVLGENGIREMNAHLASQVQALHILVEAARCKTRKERDSILEHIDTRSLLRQIHDDSASYTRAASTASSLLVPRGSTSGSSCPDDLHFQFDRAVFDSRAYRDAFGRLSQPQNLHGSNKLSPGLHDTGSMNTTPSIMIEVENVDFSIRPSDYEVPTNAEPSESTSYLEIPCLSDHRETSTEDAGEGTNNDQRICPGDQKRSERDKGLVPSASENTDPRALLRQDHSDEMNPGLSPPPSADYIRSVFTEHLSQASFPQALTALEQIKHMQMERKRYQTRALQNFDSDTNKGTSVRGGQDTDRKLDAGWIKNVTDKSKKIDKLYTKIHIGLGRWTLINKLSLEPFNKSACLALLDAIYPAAPTSSVGSSLMLEQVKIQRKIFFCYIVAVETHGKQALPDFEELSRRQGDADSYPVIHDKMEEYFRLSDETLKECVSTQHLSSAKSESLVTTKATRDSEDAAYTHQNSQGLAEPAPAWSDRPQEKDQVEIESFSQSTNTTKRAPRRKGLDALFRLVPRSEESFKARTDRLRNKEIERQLTAERQAMRKEFKMLIVGASGSGKLAFLTTAKLGLDKPYTSEKRRLFCEAIWLNLIEGVRLVLRSVEDLNVSFENEDSRDHIETVLTTPVCGRTETFPSHLGKAVTQLCKDSGFRKCLERPWNCELNNRVLFYLANADRIAKSDYVPTNEDISWLIVSNSGVKETTFDIGGMTHRVLDVGDTLTEQKRWIKRFGDVEAIIFTIDISSYDEISVKDATRNGMQEQIDLFHSVIDSPNSAETSVILIFTKMDLFKEKLSKRPMNIHFPEYTGTDYKSATDYVLSRFLPRNGKGNREIYTHFWDPTGPFPLKFLQNSVHDIIKDRNLRHALLHPCA